MQINTSSSLINHSRTLKNNNLSHRYKPAAVLQISSDALYSYKQYLSTNPLPLAKLGTDYLVLMKFIQGENLNPYKGIYLSSAEVKYTSSAN